MITKAKACIFSISLGFLVNLIANPRFAAEIPLNFGFRLELFAYIVLKQIIRCTFKNVTQSLEVFKLYAFSFIVHHLIEVLITKPQLNV